MRKIYCNNRLAKILLAFSSCHTITIGPFVLSKRSEDRITQSVRDHEYIHVRQWVEISVVSFLMLCLCIFLTGISGWWLLLSPVTFYLWYGIEFFFRYVRLKNTGKAYKAVSFEKEAYSNEDDPDYLDNGNYFGWRKYL